MRPAYRLMQRNPPRANFQTWKPAGKSSNSPCPFSFYSALYNRSRPCSPLGYSTIKTLTTLGAPHCKAVQPVLALWLAAVCQLSPTSEIDTLSAGRRWELPAGDRWAITAREPAGSTDQPAGLPSLFVRSRPITPINGFFSPHSLLSKLYFVNIQITTPSLKSVLQRHYI